MPYIRAIRRGLGGLGVNPELRDDYEAAEFYCFGTLRLKAPLSELRPPFPELRPRLPADTITAASLSTLVLTRQTIMSNAMNVSSASLDKMADKAEHVDDGGAESLQNCPEALKDMSDADLLLLEKKMVRKMDSIIL